MMKKLLFLFFFSCSLTFIGQVTNEGEPASWALSTKSNILAITLPQVDIQRVKNEDLVNDKLQAKPFRIGISHEVSYGLDNAGTWTELPNGDRIWRILFDSKDAVHLSVVFDEFFLPKGAHIYLYNDDKTDLLGAYTETQNNNNKVMGTWFVNGDKLWIEYYEPKEVKGAGKLNLGSVIHGYRLGHNYQRGYNTDIEKGFNDSGDCNHDVDCPIGADFETERDLLKKSVAFLNLGNGFICSGGLVNNTEQDKKPYFLTANHCLNGGGGANPALFSMRFKWISPDPICAAATNSTNATENLTISGSTLRARNAGSDVALVEINSTIPTSWDVTYAGWDITGNTPSFVVGIHHPRGDIMKICRDDTGVLKQVNSGAETWEINSAGGGWELGVTELGSSGSPLFDQEGRIIGQLFGGGADCDGTNDNGLLDFYGRFDVSWNSGGNSTNQLKDWLDPTNTAGLTTLDALDNVLAVDDEFLAQNIRIFPNPTSGVLQIKVREWTSELSYEVYNVLGQTLKVNELQNNEIINLSNLPSDIYFLKIIEKDTNRSLVKKIVLDKE